MCHVQAKWEKRCRGQALQLFPWICAHCGREFDSERIAELTVHHKDHDHDSNPPDGSNWELLCVHCHENEHSRQEVADSYHRDVATGVSKSTSTYRVFANLKELLRRKIE